jgi:hypothetical protein
MQWPNLWPQYTSKRPRKKQSRGPSQHEGCHQPDYRKQTPRSITSTAAHIHLHRQIRNPEPSITREPWHPILPRWRAQPRLGQKTPRCSQPCSQDSRPNCAYKSINTHMCLAEGFTSATPGNSGTFRARWMVRRAVAETGRGRSPSLGQRANISVACRTGEKNSHRRWFHFWPWCLPVAECGWNPDC